MYIRIPMLSDYNVRGGEMVQRPRGRLREGKLPGWRHRFPVPKQVRGRFLSDSCPILVRFMSDSIGSEKDRTRIGEESDKKRT